MFFKKYILFFVIFCSFSIVNIAQNKRLDSLIKLSKTAKDTIQINLYNEISWEYKSSNIDTAFWYAREALKKSLNLNHKLSIAKSYNSLGSIFQAKSKIDSAFYYHKKSIYIKRQINDSIGIADSYNNLGIISDEKGDYLEALQNYFEALKIYEKKSTNFDQVPAVLVNIGIVYKKQKQYDKVLEYYQKALKIYKDNNFKVGVVIVTGNIGGVFIKLKKYNKAIEYSNDAKKMYTDLGYIRYVPYMDANIANAEFHLQKYQASIQRYLNVIKKFKDDNNLYELCNAKIYISEPLVAVKSFSKANKQLKEGYEIANKNNFKEFKVNALKLLSEINFKLKNFKEAYQYRELYYLKKDSLFEKNKVKSINEILVKYETEKKEKEIAQQKEEILAQELVIQDRNLYASIITASLLILAIIFFGIFKKNQFKRKQLQKEIDLKDALATIKTQNRLQEQRLRISRDLHDNIGSQLTFIISSIDNLKYISKDANLKLKEKLSSISSFTGDTIHQLRDTIWAMNKNEITVEDLHSRILSFTEKAKTASPETEIEIEYHIDKNSSFSSLIGMNIFRVIQEAINNAIKYADASKITIQIDKKPEKFVIAIIDNGKGFNINTVDLGNGLSNMEKRMSEIGGKVNINAKPEVGTIITLTVAV